MALFNPQMSQAPSTFAPVPVTGDNTTANAINAVGGLVENLGAMRANAAKAEAAATEAAAIGGLFADTLRTEAEIIQGQEALVANQQAFDRLYQDGVISEEEQTELNRLQKDRVRLQSITNPRQRQVQLRMKYANFVNRFPHLTKEARIMFGDADTRLEEVAQGAQGLVDQEAFESIYGKNAYTAENISTFKNLQRYKATREIGTVYGEANFQDWSRSFEADVTTELFAIGQRMNSLVQAQGSLRTEDIDSFKAQIQTGYMDAIKQIDTAVTGLQANGQYVSTEQIQGLKEDLAATRDDMLKMAEGKDFTSRLKNLNTAMEEHFKYSQNVQLGAIARLFAGEGGGGAKGAADLATIKQLLGPNTQASVEAMKSLPGPYGDQIRMMQEGAAKYIQFLDEYDPEAAAQYIAPALSRQLASIQGQRIDNGITRDKPEAVKPLIELMEKGGTSDEVAQGLLSRAKTINEAAIRNNEAKAKLSSTVNNYALETEQYLQDVNGRIRQTENGPEVIVSTAGGRFVRSAEGTAKLRNVQQMYKQFNAVGDMTTYNSMIEKYTKERNEAINASIQELREAVQGPQGVNSQLLSHNLKQLKLQFGLTDQEVAEISAQIRSTNGPEASGG